MKNITEKCNKCSIEMFIKLALTLFFKRQQHRKLSWLDKDSDKDQSQFDELFNSTRVLNNVFYSTSFKFFSVYSFWNYVFPFFQITFLPLLLFIHRNNYNFFSSVLAISANEKN
jgi:hypothetical protein